VLVLKDPDGAANRVKISLKYIPVDMVLDPSESINNMGNLRVNVLDAYELPAADRSGFSDPYCRFLIGDKEVFKSKTIKKTLTPAWNEFFETQITSRTAANMVVKVYDWDFGDSPDFLGEAPIPLTGLEPFQPKDVVLPLNGKSGHIRLRLLFKPDYVIRSRQGSSTFSGTFAAPGRIVTGVAGAPIKGVGMVGGGVLKGASFVKHGFKSKKKGDEGITEEEDGSVTVDPATPEKLQTVDSAAPTMGSLTTTPSPAPHSRTKSIAGSLYSKGDRGSVIDLGTASFAILSATGYPADAHVRITVYQMTAKGTKEVHETKAVKEPSGTITYTSRDEFKVQCTPAQQFQLVVKDHNTFGRDKELGEAWFFIDDSGSGAEKPITVGSGTIVVKSSFEHAGTSNGNGNGNGNGYDGTNSPRRSLTKRIRG
jgi:hypothetical protein